MIGELNAYRIVNFKYFEDDTEMVALYCLSAEVSSVD